MHTSLSLRQGIFKVPLAGTETVWLKLCKTFFNLPNDIYVCFAYCVQANSTVMKEAFMPEDVYDSLDIQLAKFNSLGN